MIRFVNLFLWFVAFLLLLLVSVSLPIAKSIKFFSINLSAQEGSLRSGVTGGVNFGNWGWCTTPLVVEVLGFSHSEPGECSKPELGFFVDDKLVQLLDLEDLRNTINKTLTLALVLHPVACVLTFICLVFATFAAWRQSRIAALLGMIVGAIDALITLIAFIFDVVIVSVTRKSIKKVSDDFSVTYGATPWMTLVAMILIWVGTMTFCISIFRARRERRKETY